jgi:hypothetical protein
MEQSKFSFEITPTNPVAQLGFEAWVNDQCIFNTEYVEKSMLIEGVLPPDDIEAEHVIQFVLKNKKPSHTQLDRNGNIVTDATLNISNLTFDDIDMNHLVTKLAVYSHDFNGSQAPIQDEFFGIMGCNGSVELKFTTPIYLWLLENM